MQKVAEAHQKLKQEQHKGSDSKNKWSRHIHKHVKQWKGWKIKTRKKNKKWVESSLKTLKFITFLETPAVGNWVTCKFLFGKDFFLFWRRSDFFVVFLSFWGKFCSTLSSTEYDMEVRWLEPIRGPKSTILCLNNPQGYFCHSDTLQSFLKLLKSSKLLIRIQKRMTKSPRFTNSIIKNHPSKIR